MNWATTICIPKAFSSRSVCHNRLVKPCSQRPEHLSRIDFRAGLKVARGQVLGLVGKTGRVTGAHLDWTLSLDNARVNPALFLPTNIGVLLKQAQSRR